jgi:hypothetical protein
MVQALRHRPPRFSVSDQEAPSAPPETTAPPAAASKLTRVELLGAALAVAGAAVVTLAVLGARGEPEADVAAVRAAVASAHQPAAGTRGVHNGPGWVPNHARWVGNTRKSVAFELAADNRVAIWMRDVRPLLVVRCLAGNMDVFVFTESAAKIEPKTEDHTVRFGFDDERDTREFWPDSAEHDALFAPDGGAFARRLLTASTLRFGFTPHNAAPVTAQFHVSGLRDVIDPSAKACGGRN